MGDEGAGHFVKMVHNGIEYGDMQLIAGTASNAIFFRLPFVKTNMELRENQKMDISLFP